MSKPQSDYEKEMARIKADREAMQAKGEPPGVWVGFGDKGGLLRGAMSFTELHCRPGAQGEWVHYLNMLEAGREETGSYEYLYKAYHQLRVEVEELRRRLAIALNAPRGGAGMRLTLCGSARFEEDFRRLDGLLTLGGHVVYNLAIYPSEREKKNWYTEEQKTILDKAHKLKIDNSEAIVVINRDGYIGDSTKSEIEHAIRTGKPRYYTHLVPTLDPSGIRWCPFNYCREAGRLATPPCPVCYEQL